MAMARFILRLYPRSFRERFEKEMLQTFASADADYKLRGMQAHCCFLAIEVLGAVRGLLGEWASRQQLETSAHRLGPLAVAIALHAALYAYLLPIGPRAAATTGAWFLLIGCYGLMLAALVELLCAVLHWSGLHPEDQ